MGDLCSGLLILLLVIAILAVVGHGIWAIGAAVIQALFGEQTRKKPDPLSEHCVGCGQELDIWMHQCPVCLLARNSPAARQLGDLYLILRRLRELQDQGVIDEPLVNQVQDAFQAHRASVVAELAPRPRRMPVAAAVPVAAPEPVAEVIPLKRAEPEVVPLKRPEPAPLPVLEVVPIPSMQAVLVEEVVAELEPRPKPEPVAPLPSAPPAQPPRRRRPFTELLTAFMEERNILWGEVVGGLLIVGCSVALVISLWQTLQRIPYFPFLIIATVTASVFGAGLYTLERWKLQSTSRGLLMIGSLLVPLNLLVMAALHRDRGGQFDWLEIAVLGGFLVLFTYLLRRAGRVLLPEHSGLYPAAVLGTSAFEVAVPLLGTPPGVGAAMLLGSAGAICHSGTASRLIRHTARKPALEEGHAQRLFGFLGVSTFALATLLGLLIYASDASPAMLQGLAPLVALGGVPLLAGGALVHRRLADDPGSATMRTVGTGIALAGSVIQLSAIGLAWPDPLYLGLVCLLNFVVLTDAAFRWRLPLLHAAALPSLALGYLTGWHWLVGGSAGLVEWIGSATAGSALVPLVALLALLSEWLSRCDRRADSISYAMGSGALALASLALVSVTGLAEPMRAGAVCLLYAAGVLGLNQRWRRTALGYAGLVLVALGTVWLLQGRVPGQWELWAATLAGEALLLGLLSTFTQQTHLRLPARDLGMTCACLAGILSAVIPIVPGLSWTTGTWAILAATALTLAWSYRQAALTWLGPVLALLAIANGVDVVWTPAALLTACLGQATLTGLIARGVQRFGSAEADDIIAGPLDRATLLATFLALPLLALPGREQMLSFMAHAGWLAAIWLVFALERRWVWLFAGFQAALAVMVFFGTTAWLVGQTWVASAYPVGLLDPRSLQAYGIGLTGLSLVWAILRPLLRRRQWIQDLLEPGWPAFDRVLLAELVVLQLGLALWGVLPAVMTELSLTELMAEWPASAVHATGSAAWVLLALMTVVLAVRLWDRPGSLQVLGLVVNGVAAAMLAAGAMPLPATALADGLAGVFLIGSLLLWLRQPLLRLAGLIGIEGEGIDTESVRWALLGGCVAVIVVLSLVRLFVPQTAETPFWAFSLPLAAVGVTLVGHALRERLADYAFAGGLFINLALVGGVGLALAPLDMAEWVQLLQLGSLGAAVWALLWLGSRRWVDAWTEAEPGGILMNWQVGMAAIGNLTLLIVGGLGLVAWEPGLAASGWTAAAGLPLGWIAFILSAAALGYRAWLRDEAFDQIHAAVLGMAPVVLVACSVTGVAGSEWGYRAWMMGTAFFALAWSLRAVPAKLGEKPEQAATFCVGLGYGLAVLLGLKAAFVHHDHLWAASAIGLSACVGALMSVWLRREDWAFAAGLGLNLATLLVVWHQHLGMPVWDWWYALLQANCIASGLVALIWLAARERFLGTGQDDANRPFLAGQVALALVGNLPVLGLAFLALFLAPQSATSWAATQVANIGLLGGWLALLIPLAAAIWHASQVKSMRLMPLLVWHALGCGVLAGCFALPWDTGNWLAFHVMTGVWLLVALGATGLTLIKHEEGFRLFDVEIERWIGLIGGLVVLLALRGSLADPRGPFWSAGAVLGVAAVAVRLGIWTERPQYAYVSGLLIVLAGNLVWLDQGPRTVEALISVNALCLGLGSLLWTAIVLTTGKPALAGTRVPFDRLARHASLLLLVGVVVTILTADLRGLPTLQTGTPDWVALFAVALAQLLGWKESGRLGGLYATGLVAVGLLLHQLGLRTDELAWGIGLALANYILATALLTRLWNAGEDSPSWFVLSQVSGGLLAAGLGLWVSAHFPGLAERLAGPLALGQLLIAAVLLANGKAAGFFRHIAFVLAGLVVIAINWTVLGQPVHVPWLHRNVALLAALLLTACGLTALQSFLPDDWRSVARRMASWWTLTAGLALLVVIAQEALSYNRALDPKRTELELWAILAGVAACIYLMNVALRSALGVEGFSITLPERWRTVPVYLAELILFFLFMHVRLTSPWLFGKWLAPYWMFAVMAMVFVGVGISEVLRRRGLTVLAEPLARTGLLLPLVPLLAFWVNEPAGLIRPWMVQVVPGSEPMLHYLELMTRDWQKYSLVWLLTGVAYGLTAVSRRSFRHGLIAAVAVNFSLWSLWQHAEISFLVHPQFFLIPLAVIVLAAVHINRGRLTPPQAQSLRYAALGLLYLSSTADMFIAGLDQVGWPLFLMLLCVAGVLAGMLLEVRAYLFLGTGFLFLVIFSMIWHTAVDKHQPWIWWASGIVLGAAILGLFAVFEKRRNDVLQVVERIKGWN